MNTESEEDMTNKDDGGAAFPKTFENWQGGMSLRDYFAGQALAGITANSSLEPNEELAYASAEEGYARQAYELADAMLKARNP